jgi:hypothetical protein
MSSTGTKLFDYDYPQDIIFQKSMLNEPINEIFFNSFIESHIFKEIYPLVYPELENFMLNCVNATDEIPEVPIKIGRSTHGSKNFVIDESLLNYNYMYFAIDHADEKTKSKLLICKKNVVYIKMNNEVDEYYEINFDEFNNNFNEYISKPNPKNVLKKCSTIKTHPNKKFMLFEVLAKLCSDNVENIMLTLNIATTYEILIMSTTSKILSGKYLDILHKNILQIAPLCSEKFMPSLLQLQSLWFDTQKRTYSQIDKVNEITHGEFDLYRFEGENTNGITTISNPTTVITTDNINEVLKPHIEQFYESTDGESISYVNSALILMSEIIDNIEKLDIVNINYVIYANMLVKIPYDILTCCNKHNKMYNDYGEAYNHTLHNLCNMFGKWLHVCAILPTVHLYKYSYFILIHNLLLQNSFSKEVFENFREAGGDGHTELIKNFKLEFIADVNRFACDDWTIQHVIKEMKVYIHKSLIWFDNYASLDELCYMLHYVARREEIYMKKYVTSTEKIETDFFNINIATISDLNVDNVSKHVETPKGPSEKYKINFSDVMFTNNKHIEIDSSSLIIAIPNFKHDKGIFLYYNAVLALIKIAYCCKYNDVSKCDYPNTVPIGTVDVFLKDGKLMTESTLYPTHHINEKINTQTNITGCTVVNNDGNIVDTKYVGQYYQFNETEDPDVLAYSDIIPFKKFGLSCDEPTSLTTYVDIEHGIVYDSNVKTTFDLDTLLLNKSEKPNMTIKMLIKSSFSKLVKNMYVYYLLYEHGKINLGENAYMYTYDDFNEITESMLYTKKELLDAKNISLTHKLMCASNAVKYYIYYASKAPDFATYRNHMDMAQHFINIFDEYVRQTKKRSRVTQFDKITKDGMPTQTVEVKREGEMKQLVNIINIFEPFVMPIMTTSDATGLMELMTNPKTVCSTIFSIMAGAKIKGNYINNNPKKKIATMPTMPELTYFGMPSILSMCRDTFNEGMIERRMWSNHQGTSEEGIKKAYWLIEMRILEIIGINYSHVYDITTNLYGLAHIISDKRIKHINEDLSLSLDEKLEMTHQIVEEYKENLSTFQRIFYNDIIERINLTKTYTIPKITERNGPARKSGDVIEINSTFEDMQQYFWRSDKNAPSEYAEEFKQFEEIGKSEIFYLIIAVVGSMKGINKPVVKIERPKNERGIKERGTGATIEAKGWDYAPIKFIQDTMPKNEGHSDQYYANMVLKKIISEILYFILYPKKIIDEINTIYEKMSHSIKIKEDYDKKVLQNEVLHVKQLEKGMMDRLNHYMENNLMPSKLELDVYRLQSSSENPIFIEKTPASDLFSFEISEIEKDLSQPSEIDDDMMQESEMDDGPSQPSKIDRGTSQITIRLKQIAPCIKPFGIVENFNVSSSHLRSLRYEDLCMIIQTKHESYKNSLDMYFGGDNYVLQKYRDFFRVNPTDLRTPDLIKLFPHKTDIIPFITSEESVIMTLPYFNFDISSNTDIISSEIKQTVAQLIMLNLATFISNTKIIVQFNDTTSYFYLDSVKSVVVRSVGPMSNIKNLYIDESIKKDGMRKIYFEGLYLLNKMNKKELSKIHNIFDSKRREVTMPNKKEKINGIHDGEKIIVDFATADELKEIRKRSIISISGKTTMESITYERVGFHPIKIITAISFKKDVNDMTSTFRKEYSSVDQIKEFMFEGYMVDNESVAIHIPYYVGNITFLKQFNWFNGVGTPAGNYPKYKCNIINNNIVKDTTDEKFIPFWVAINHIESLLHKLLFTTTINNIICWGKDNNVTCVEIIDQKIRYVLREEKYYFNDEYELCDDSMVDWQITRWISGIPNFFLLRIDNTYAIHMLPLINSSSGDVADTLDVMPPTMCKSVYTTIVKTHQEHTIIKISQTTNFPIITNPVTLLNLCMGYLCFGSIGNILELSSLLKKMMMHDSTVGEVLYKLFSDVGNESADKFVKDILKQIASKPEKNKIQFGPYEKTYKLIEEKPEYDDFLFNYYFPQHSEHSCATLPEYYVNSLITNSKFMSHNMSDYAYTLFYNKLVYLYANVYDEDVRDELDQILKREHVHNPLEFFYQYIIGFFARDDQMELVTKIMIDIDKEVEPMTGGNRMFTNSYELNEKFFNKSSSDHLSNIHTLTMGKGKTKMITPLVIIRYFQQKSSQDIDENNNVYTILPQKLVQQSLEYLMSTLGLFYPINVKSFEETRDGENVGLMAKTLEESGSDKQYETYVYVISDTTLKCSFINSYDKTRLHYDKHAYLIDESHIILNPMVSELNYPQTAPHVLSELSSYFDPIYDILKSLYVKSLRPVHVKEIVELDGQNDFSESPHLNVINSQAGGITLLKNYVISELTRYYDEHNDTVSSVLKNINDFEHLTKIDVVQYDQKTIDILYVLYNFINTVFPSVLEMKNRKDYGLVPQLLTTVPFAYAETPLINSKFISPLFTLILTITAYITYIDSDKLLSPLALSKMIEIIIFKYKSTPSQVRRTSEISTEYIKLGLSITLDDLFEISQLMTNDLLRLSKSDYFIKMLCKHVCDNYITYEPGQDTISGVDLFMSFNIKHKSGFTGTPNIPEFFDVRSDMSVNIKTDEKSNTLIDHALQMVLKTIIVYPEISTHYDILCDMADKSNEKMKVIIDVGAAFLGQTPIDIWKMLLNIPKYDKVEEFVYWDDHDVPRSISRELIISKWNGIEGDKIFYYYDNSHTTGIDAKIPIGTTGTVFLGKNSKYRDVVQGMFRMRKVDNGKHLVQFAISDKLLEYAKATTGRATDMSVDMLTEWFDLEERNFTLLQMGKMKQQNLCALSRLTKRVDPFRIPNMFAFPKENTITDNNNFENAYNIMFGITSEYKEHISRLIDHISENKDMYDMEYIGRLLERSFVNVPTLGISIQVQQQISMGNILSVENQIAVASRIIKLPKITTSLKSNDTIEKYLDMTNDEYYVVDEQSYGIMVISKNLKYFEPPYFVLTKEHNGDLVHFVIPLLEGIKIRDLYDVIGTYDKALIKTSESFCVHDSLGNLYAIVNKFVSNEMTSCRIKFVIKKLIPKTFLTMSDYIMFVDGRMLQNKKMNDYVCSIVTDDITFNSFKEFVEEYDDSTEHNKHELNAKIQAYNSNSSIHRSLILECIQSRNMLINYYFNFFTYEGKIEPPSLVTIFN